MSLLKPFLSSLVAMFSSLVAIYETEPVDGSHHGYEKGNDDEPHTAQTRKGEVCDTRSSSVSRGKGNAELIVRKVWRKLVLHAQKNETSGVNHLRTTAISNMEGSSSLNVAQEVFTRELISAFEAMGLTGDARNEEQNSNTCGERARINSLEHGLKEESAHIGKARKDIQGVMRAGCDLEQACGEYEKKLKKVSQQLREYKAENKGLRRKNMHLGDQIEQLEADLELVHNAKKAEEVEVLRACHRAEMAELAAKQASLQCAKLDRQLKTAKTQSRQAYKKLKTVKGEMKDEVVSSRSSVETSGEHRYNENHQWRLYTRLRLVSRLKAMVVHEKNGPDGGGRNRRDAKSGAEDGEVTFEESSSPRSWGIRKLLPTVTSRRAGETQPSVLRAITSRLRIHRNGSS